MSIERFPQARKHLAIKASRRNVLGARRVSDVKITRADGSVEIQPAYKHAEAMNVVGVRRRHPQSQRTTPAKLRVRAVTAMTKEQRQLLRWNDEHGTKRKATNSQ